MDKKKSKNPFAGDVVSSMKRRSYDHDYTEQCFYMVTLAVEGRRPLLGSVVGRGDATVGNADAPHVELSPLGMAVCKAWSDISVYYPQVAIIAQQVMPDHFHGILYFREKTSLRLGDVIRGFKVACNRAYRGQFPLVATVSQQTREGVSGSPSSYASAVSQQTREGVSGSPSSYAATVSQQKRGLLWEKGYNDRILHNYSTLDKWKAYLHDNPRRLLMKREHPDLFRVQRNLEYAGMSFSAIGNRFLLDCPMKVQVQCSRSITADALTLKIQNMLALGAKGAVFVSPCISKGEAAVMHAVFVAGYPVIYLQENGFTEMAKPGGKRFDACARGQMLILAPWEHHNERVLITRNKCLLLNEMAWRICETSLLR